MKEKRVEFWAYKKRGKIFPLRAKTLEHAMLELHTDFKGCGVLTLIQRVYFLSHDITFTYDTDASTVEAGFRNDPKTVYGEHWREK